MPRHPAGRDVLDPAAVRYVDLLFPHDRVDGRGQRREEAVDLPVPVGVILRNLTQHGPQRVDGFADGRGWHLIADVPQLLAVGVPDRLPQLDPQLSGRGVLTRAGQEAGQPAHPGPVRTLYHGAGQRHRAANHLGPQQAGLRVGTQQLRLPLTAVLARLPVARLLRPWGIAEDLGQSGRLQHFPGEEEQILALRGQLPGPGLVFGHQEPGEDSRLDGHSQRQVRGLIRHVGLPNAARANEYKEATE